jgi:hypothetical protein
MLSTVLRIFKSCPKLVQVNLRWAREKCLNHLKQEGVYDVVEWEEEDGDGRGKRGNAMTEGFGRLPKTLMVSERGIPLIGKPFSRRYKYTLPGGTGNRKRGLLLKGGKGNRWRWEKKRRVVSGVAGGGVDVDVDVDEGAAVVTSPVVVENESIESETELDTDTEVEVEEEVGTNEKGKEVKRIGLPTPTTN